MTRARLILAAALAAILVSPALALDGNRIRVIDGDTVALGAERIRLVDIDAPEIAHPRCPAELQRGLKARDRLAALLRGRDVQITRDGRDRYGRTLATLTVAGRSVGAVLISEGFAVQWEPGRAAYAARLRYWCGRAQ